MRETPLKTNWRKLASYKGIPIVYRTGMTHQKMGHPLGARLAKDAVGIETIYLDRSELQKSFDIKQWTKPRVPGIIPLPEDFFPTVDHWVSHVLEHEYQHTLIPTPEKMTKEEYAEYEMRVDDAALEARGLPLRTSF